MIQNVFTFIKLSVCAFMGLFILNNLTTSHYLLSLLTTYNYITYPYKTFKANSVPIKLFCNMIHCHAIWFTISTCIHHTKLFF